MKTNFKLATTLIIGMICLTAHAWADPQPAPSPTPTPLPGAVPIRYAKAYVEITKYVLEQLPDGSYSGRYERICEFDLQDVPVYDSRSSSGVRIISPSHIECKIPTSLGELTISANLLIDLYTGQFRGQTRDVKSFNFWTQGQLPNSNSHDLWDDSGASTFDLDLKSIALRTSIKISDKTSTNPAATDEWFYAKATFEDQ